MLARKQDSGEISDLVGIIHTPLPATPLCVEAEWNSPIDPRKWATVLSRAQILCEYFSKGSKLYVVYPQGGLEKRNLRQRQGYCEALISRK